MFIKLNHDKIVRYAAVAAAIILSVLLGFYFFDKHKPP